MLWESPRKSALKTKPPPSTCGTEVWRAYYGLVLNGYDHYRVFHSENEFARGKRLSQRNRELLELREGKAREVQRLQFRRFRATLEGVFARLFWVRRAHVFRAGKRLKIL